jgi:hypothetical protein
MELLWVLIVGGLTALLWRHAIDAHDLALSAAHQACREAGAQLLDGAVVFKSWRFAHRPGRLRTLERTYLFDYCDDGSTRRQGFIILKGGEVELVGLGPTLMHEQRH